MCVCVRQPLQILQKQVIYHLHQSTPFVSNSDTLLLHAQQHKRELHPTCYEPLLSQELLPGYEMVHP